MTEPTRRLHRTVGPTLVLGSAAVWAVLPAHAIEVDARVSVGAIYSDNVNLAPDGFEQDDVILRAAPSIVVTSEGSRYDFELEYTLEALYYQDARDSTEVFSQGGTRLDFEILDERLFLNSSASIAQVVVDPEQPFSLSNVPQISNRSDEVRYEVGPEWRQDILGNSLVVRYDVGHVDYDADELQDVDYQNLNSDLRGPDKDRGLGWSARHEYRLYEYDQSTDATRQLAELSLILHLGGGWAPFVSGGLESDVSDRTDASLTDGIWRAGLRRTTVRTAFEAFAGERSFGSSWGASFERQYGADSGDIFRISYDETPRTSEDLSASRSRFTESDETIIPGSPVPGSPVPGAGTPGSIDFGSGGVAPLPVVVPNVVTPGSGRFYLHKRADFLLAKVFNRSTVSVNVFYDETENLADDPALNLPVDDNDQTGASFVWLYRIGARTTALLEGYGARRSFARATGPDDDDTLLSGRVGLRYQLGQKTDVSGWVRREQRRGSSDEGNNYTENQVGVSLGRNF